MIQPEFSNSSWSLVLFLKASIMMYKAPMPWSASFMSLPTWFSSRINVFRLGWCLRPIGQGTFVRQHRWPQWIQSVSILLKHSETQKGKRNKKKMKAKRKHHIFILHPFYCITLKDYWAKMINNCFNLLCKYYTDHIIRVLKTLLTTKPKIR